MQRSLSVCHLGKYYPPAAGGIETHVRTLARAQSALGIDVTVLCVNHANRRGVDMTWARYGATGTQHDADGAVRVIRVGRSATAARFDICPALPRIIRELNRRPPDVFHLHTPNVTMLLTVSALTSGSTPLIITHHTDIVRQHVLKWVLAPYERRVYERSDCVLTSAGAYAGGSELLRKHIDKVEVLPMGLDLTGFLQPSEATLAEEEKIRQTMPAPLWLAVGRCVYYKGLQTAIEALKYVPGTLLIVGRGPLEVALHQAAERARVAERVRWWRYAPEEQLAGAYRAAEALWFPSNSRGEAFGLVQIEAMASGCPVINTHIPDSGVPWVSRHEETGLTVPMNDAKALARAARRILRERGLRARLAETARNRAISEFSDDTMAQRSLAVYERVLAARHANPVSAGARLSDWVRRMSRSVPAQH
ncbi:MAG: glycosyltransferase [Tepidisphaeraceae bacterium]